MRILSVDGGGYLGLASASFLDATEKHFGVKTCDRFDMFCGTSTGAIIALALASGKSGAEIVGLYRELGTRVFPSCLPRGWRPIRKVRQLVWSKYSNKELRRCLQETFGDTTLGQLCDRGKKVIVPAFCVTTGLPRVFKTDHSAGLTAHKGYKLVDVALASSAAPVYFPLVKINKPGTDAPESFCDGGLVANHPALMGFVEALDECKVPPPEISLFSLSTPRMSHSRRIGWPWQVNRGLVQWGTSLPAIMIDAPSVVAHQLLMRLVRSWPEPRPIYERVELPNQHKIGIDAVRDQDSGDLESIGRNAAEDGATRRRLIPFYGT